MNALEQAASQKAASGSTPAQGAQNWSADVAAADRILTELLGPASTTGAATPAPAGTTGSTATAPKTTTSGKSLGLDHARRLGAHQASGSAHEHHRVCRGDERRVGPEPVGEPGSTAAPSNDDPSASASASAASATPSAAHGAATPAPTSTPATTASAERQPDAGHAG